MDSKNGLPAMNVITEKFCGQDKHADVSQRADVDKLLNAILNVPLVYCHIC